MAKESTTIKKNCIEKMLMVMDQSISSTISSFLFKFVICESSYKALSGLVFSKQKTEIRINEVKTVKQKMNLNISDDAINLLFGPNQTAGERSIKKLRDAIVHSLNKNAVSEVMNRYSILNDTMDIFIKAVIEIGNE